jgi:putative ABC transport system permease protein
MPTQDDFDRELQSHLEHEADDFIRGGLPPDQARRAARLTFGNVTAARERHYERRRWLWLDRVAQDVRGAWRSMRQYPVAAAVAILSLAFGIGATTVTLTVRNVLFHKAPPLYSEPSQISLVQLGQPESPIRRIGNAVPPPLYLAWQSALGTSIAGSRSQPQREVRAGNRTETVAMRAVTPNLFAVLGVDPIAGQVPSSPSAAVVLSYRVWQQIFDGRPDAIGTTVLIDNEPFTVAAVMPERFWYADMNSPIWTLLDVRRLGADEALEVVVRRPGGTSPAMLQARLRPAVDDYARQLPQGQRNFQVGVSGIEGTPLGRSVAIVLPYVLAVAVLLTLLIACANVAVLMIAQWTAREHEIAIRASIGASRGRIVQALLTESVVIAGLGGALGTATAALFRAWIIRTGGGNGFYDLSIDPQIFVATVLITVLTGVTAGLAPALYETRRLQTNPLRAMAGSDRVRQRWRHALVVFEITVTIALLVQTTSLINGYRRAQQPAMGFSTSPLLTARVENPRGLHASQIVEALRGLPGVANAAAATAMPFGGRGPTERVAASSGGDPIAAERAAIDPSFFTTLGVARRSGRPFSAGDTSAGRTAILNEALARRLFGERSPIGATVWIGTTSYDVVGLVSNYSNDPFREPDASPRIFMPLAGEPQRRLTFVVSASDPSSLVQPARRALRDAAVGNAVSGVFTADEVQRVGGQEILVGTAPLVPLIAIGMVLTAAGIYGVLAFAIARRGRELAVRVAVGASSRDVVRIVTSHTMRLVATGAGIGIGFTFGLSRIVRAGGGAGSIFDPSLSAFLVPLGVIVLIGIAATWLPARRAAAIDPVKLLRTS